jgi:alpha-L-fucosidase
MTVNGESIYDTTYGPIQGASGYRTTAKGSNIYIHVFDWPANSLQVAGLKSKVVSARLLANNQPLSVVQTQGNLQIHVPVQAPDKQVSVIALRTL